MGTQVRLTQSGGLAGLDMVAQVDVDELPPDQAARVREALAAADLPALAGQAPGPPQGADRFQYDIAVTEGGRTQHVTVHEPGVPAELQPLIDVLRPLARPG
jgi:hypothetical protein